MIATAEAMNVRGRYAHIAGELHRAVDFYRPAIEMARPLGQPRLLIALYSNLAGSLQHLAEFEESDEMARRCRELGEKEVVAEFGAGTFPDGLTLDAQGGVWITSIVSNRVIRVTPEGDQEIVLEDSDPDHLAWVEEAYQAGELGRPQLDGLN